MNKKIFALFSFLLLLPVSYAVKFDVTVEEILNFKAENLNYELDENLLLLNISIYNIGSTGSFCRVRFEVFENGKMVNSFWSEKKTILPGDFENFQIIGFLEKSGNYTGRIRGYCGNEIFHFGNISFEVEKNYTSSSILKIRSVSSSLNEIEILFIPKVSGDIYIIPLEYPISWIVVGEKVKVERGIMEKVSLWFNGPLFNNTIKIGFVGKDGVLIEEVRIEKKENFLDLFFKFFKSFLLGLS